MTQERQPLGAAVDEVYSITLINEAERNLFKHNQTDRVVAEQSVSNSED